MLKTKSTKNRSSILRNKLFVSVTLIMAVGIVLSILEFNGVTNFYSRNKSTGDEVKTTSTAPTAQEDFSGGTDREPGNTIDENEGSAELSDNNGTLSQDADTSNPQSSTTGEITLYNPKKSTTVQSPIRINGSSNLPLVSYRLIDNVSGVISSGEIKVINSNFSAELLIKSTASEARLDIFATRADGTEYSIIEMPLRLK